MGSRHHSTPEPANSTSDVPPDRARTSRLVAVGPGRPSGPGSRFDAALMLGIPPEDAPVFPVQRAKVQAPPLRDETLPRERLLDWVSAKIHQRAVFVVAEAGYGKTTLLADFARRTHVRTMWYRLDEQDRDPVGFLNYLVAAGRELVPDFAPTTEALLRELATGGVSHETLVATFVRELRGLGPEGAALIIDDYHLVDDVPEVRSIVQAVLRDGPERLTLVLLSRRTPRLAVARLRTLGELAELSTDDLRFRTDETERLFRESYRRPLEKDVLDELSRRTEGWAASLHLVRTALRDRSPGEVRTFVRSLSGTQHQLYDYLAEEVVADLDPGLQDFLMRTSILQVVEPDVAATVTCLDEEPTRRRMEEAERVGLLGRRGETRWSDRYHPLVQQFLAERLTRGVGRPAVLELHRTVARFGEDRDWRLAIHHWAAAGDGPDVRRVLAAAIPSVMGTGQFALAESYLERFPAPERTPVFEVLLSRLDFYRNRIDTALSRARWAAEMAAADAPIALVNLAALEFMTGHVDRSAAVMAQLGEPGDAVADSLRDIAEGMRQIISSGNDGDLDVFVERLEAILSAQLSRGETHYAGVTALNLSVALRQQGLAEQAHARSSQAIDLLGEHALGPELAAAYSARAWANAHVGNLTAAEADLGEALKTKHELARAEVQSEAADLFAWYGDLARAADYLEQARESSEATPVLKSVWRLAATEIALRQRHWSDAQELLAGLDAAGWYGTTGQRARVLALLAYAALGTHADDADIRAREALSHAARQKAYLWVHFIRLLTAIHADASALNVVLVDLANRDPALVSVLADALSTRLQDLKPESLDWVTEAAIRNAAPWRRSLRSAVTSQDTRINLAAARLLDRIGEASDVPLLRKVAKKMRRRGADARLGKSLARRLAPHMSVEDLGRTELRIGSTRVAGSAIRPKVLALLLFLVSRPGFSATHDQVLDALWPDQAPKEGLNSLNQTIYFLRRVMEPEYDDDQSPEYVHHQSDLLWLDEDLVTSRSQQCWQLATNARRNLLGEGPNQLAELYTGPFALDFAYEDWAQGYRDRLHSLYLEVMERAALEHLNRNDLVAALRLADAAVLVDPTAEPLHLLVIRLCQRMGAHSAAAERYAAYAAYARDELGIEPQPLEGI